MKSEECKSSISKIKDKEARLAAILALTKEPDKLSFIMEAIAVKQTLVKHREKLSKFTQHLTNNRDRIAVESIILRFGQCLDSLLSFDDKVAIYLKTSKKHNKVLEKRFNDVIKDKTDEDIHKFRVMLDNLDALNLRLASSGVDHKGLMKLLVDFKDKERAKVQTVSKIDEQFADLKFFRDYINDDN